jgi:hypothetical protein
MMDKKNIINQNERDDLAGLLGKAVLKGNELKLIYKVSKVANSSNVNINVVNKSDNDAKITIWLADTGFTGWYQSTFIPADIDIYETDVTIKPKAVYFRTNLVLSKSEGLYIISDIDDVIIRVDGYEDNPL